MTPGYYSVLFEDPDGIRLEVDFVAGIFGDFLSGRARTANAGFG
jgi:hypothetical protein